MDNLKKFIRSIPDFPKQGIMFRDITTLLASSEGLSLALEQLFEEAKDKGVTRVVGIESRGFILGGALAQKLGCGFVPVRKPGKLPGEKIAESYSLEYGTDTIEIHADAIKGGDIVLLHDDLLATGGTAKAACKLIERLGGKIVLISFLIELSFLQGREVLKGYEVSSLIEYADEKP